MTSSKTISFSILSTGIIIAGAILFTNIATPKEKNLVSSPSNAFIQDGNQTIEIVARGGFTPKKTVAKAGVQTILKITTKGTFDCSSVVSIPELNIIKNLPNTGVTEIDLGIHQKGILFGTCGMGMYPFEIDFI